MEDKKFEFMLEAYKTYVEYYRGYIDGMWVRFNTLLTIDIALVGVYGTTFTTTTLVSSKGIYLFPILGIMVSIMLYIQSAQERYILSNHRTRIDELRQALQNEANSGQINALFAPLDDIDRGKQILFTNNPFKNPFSWRSSFLSITRLPAWVSLAFIAIWVFAVIISPKSNPVTPDKPVPAVEQTPQGTPQK